jgi:hypothetical protein
MVSIAHALESIKHNPLDVLGRQAIEKLCIEHGHDWRDRQLDPATTIAIFLQQVVHGNVPLTEVPLLVRQDFTASAFCQARSRLPLKVCQALVTMAAERARPVVDEVQHLWHGHRVWIIDGSTFSMPDTPELRKAFGLPSGQLKDCGFPVARLMVLFSAATGLLLEASALPGRTGELSQVSSMHLRAGAGDLFLGDTLYGSYAHLALLLERKQQGLFPMHQKRTVDFTPHRPYAKEGSKGSAGLPRSEWIKSLGWQDQLVRYFKPQQKPAWMTREQFAALPESIVVREMRRTVRRKGMGKVTLTLVTTLTDPQKYPAGELVELRLQRWEVETNLGYLKTTMGLDVLKCKSEAGVRKELCMFGLAYNLVRVVMLEAARRQKVSVKRISFSNTLKWMRHARPGDELPKLVVNPHRPNRVEPRCKKRRPKQYDLMRKPRKKLQEMLRKQARKA